MNQLTITIQPSSGDLEHREGVRVLRGQWRGKTEDQADVIVWRKEDQPWFPHVLGAAQDLGQLPMGKVFMAMAAEASLPDEELRHRLHGVCEGLGVDRARMMATGLGVEEAAGQRAVLALLSSNPDIVILSEPDAQRLALLQQLAEDYAPVPKTFWLLGGEADGAKGAKVGPVDFRWQAQTSTLPHLDSPAMGSVATASMPRGLEVAGSVAQPGLAVLSAAELQVELSKELGKELDDVSTDATIAHITGTGPAEASHDNERITYDLSAAVGPDASEVVVWVKTGQPVRLIWGCLSRHRRPPPAKVTLVVDPDGDAVWLAMAASAEAEGSMGLTARVGCAGRLTITHASPSGLPFGFDQGLHLAEGAKVTLYSLAFCDQPFDQPWGQGSEKSASPAQPSQQRTGVEAHRVRLAFESSSALPRSNQDPEAIVHAPAAYVLLQSAQVADPCATLLSCAVPWLEAQLPMEYRVDLITLLESILRRP